MPRRRLSARHFYARTVTWRPDTSCRFSARRSAPTNGMTSYGAAIVPSSRARALIQVPEGANATGATFCGHTLHYLGRAVDSYHLAGDSDLTPPLRPITFYRHARRFRVRGTPGLSKPPSR